MKRILLIIVLLSTTYVLAQQKTFEKEVQKISKNIERITQQEKDSLKFKIERINLKIESGKITISEANKLKKQVAQYHATKIENRVGVEEKKLQQLVQDKTNGKIASMPEEDIYKKKGVFKVGNKRFTLDLDFEDDETNFETRLQNLESNRHPRTGEPFKNERQRQRHLKRAKREFSRVTTSHFIFAMGVNNVLLNNNINSIENSPYGFWNSHMYEIGWTWKTRFTQKPSKLYFKYGVSFLWNNLRASNNQYHVKNGNVTQLQAHQNALTESRLRHTQIIFPLNIELDFSKNKYYSSGKIRDRRNNSFRIGLGVFAGFKMGTRQYIDFVDASGVKVTELIKDDYNTNILNYGVGANIGYQSTSLFVKYDLNPLFKNTTTRNIAFGVRLEL